MSTPIVVLDACVLIPEWLRDLFLRAAEAGLVQYRWTPRILDEVGRNLQSDFGLSTGQAAKLCGLTVPVEEVLKLTAAELDALLDRSKQRVQ